MTEGIFAQLTRRRLLQGAAASTLAVALTGRGAIAQSSGGELVIGHPTFRHLNPAIQSGNATGVPGTQIFAGLVRLDDKFAAQPYLAESWEVASDGLSFTFHLRGGATFHDGKPVTSEDVAFSLATVKANHPFGPTMFNAVTEVQTPDPKVARIVLDRPHPALLSALSPLLMPVIPKHVFEAGNIRENEANLRPIGSGPYRFVDYKAGEFLILEKNPDFFLEGRPHLDRLLFSVSPDPVTNVLGLERGDLDYLPFALVRVRDVKRLAENENLVITTDGYEALGATNYLEFNHRVAPLDDLRVRKAIAYAIDRDFIASKLLQGETPRLDGPLTGSNPFNAPDSLTRYDLDLGKAEALLDEAGHPRGANGVRFTLTLEWLPDANINSQEPVAQYLKPQLAKIGVDIQLRPNPDFASYAARISNWEHQLAMNGIWNYPDPVIGVHRAYACANQRKGVMWSNTEGYCNQRVDEIFAAAAVEADAGARKALYAEFQKIVTDELPMTWTNEEPLYTIYKKGLVNPPLSVWGALAPFDEISWG